MNAFIYSGDVLLERIEVANIEAFSRLQDLMDAFGCAVLSDRMAQYTD